VAGDIELFSWRYSASVCSQQWEFPSKAAVPFWKNCKNFLQHPRSLDAYVLQWLEVTWHKHAGRVKLSATSRLHLSPHPSVTDTTAVSLCCRCATVPAVPNNPTIHPQDVLATPTATAALPLEPAGPVSATLDVPAAVELPVATPGPVPAAVPAALADQAAVAVVQPDTDTAEPQGSRPLAESIPLTSSELAGELVTEVPVELAVAAEPSAEVHAAATTSPSVLTLTATGTVSGVTPAIIGINHGHR
jgi:hypothetical protein